MRSAGTLRSRKVRKTRKPAGTAAVLLGTLGLAAGLHAQSGELSPVPEEIAEAGRGTTGSPYIPVDSWIYPAATRLFELGYLPTLYLGMRPYTRVSLAHALSLSASTLDRGNAPDEALEIYARLKRELAPELRNDSAPRAVAESVYGRVRGVHGPVLNDSFHFGQTFVNDYGRPYQEGVNGIAGYSAYGTAGRFNLYVRGEYQHAPAVMGYSTTVANTLKTLDQLPLAGTYSTVPQGAIAARNQSRLLEANVSAHLGGHQFSFGKSDSWLGPAQGASTIYSNNSEPVYAFRINRIEPLYVPLLSRVTGLVRYEFFVGSLKGHEVPNAPWLHLEKISFKPTTDLEIGFARTVIWGGKGHVPITVGTFLRSFFSIDDAQPAVKFSRDDPGARFSSFDVSYRIPFNDYLFTVYADSFVHDDVFPVSAPKRAAIRPGLYLARLPGLPRVDLRVEGISTDPPATQSTNGGFLLYESVQKQGYTNRSFLLGDWIGRENKGGQAWLTWHVRPDQQVQLEYRQQKAAKDFLAGGTTQQDIGMNLRLRPACDLEVQAAVQGELWRAPLLRSGTQNSVAATFGVTWYPDRVIRSAR